MMVLGQVKDICDTQENLNLWIIGWQAFIVPKCSMYTAQRDKESTVLNNWEFY